MDQGRKEQPYSLLFPQTPEAPPRRRWGFYLLCISSFTSQPSSIVVTEGSVGRLACSINANPPPIITWEFNRVSLPLSTERSTRCGVEDAGNYRWHSKPTSANRLRSVEATLTVTPALLPPPPQRPLIVAGPQNTSVALHHSAVLECLATGSPRPLVSWSRADGRSIDVHHSRVLGNGNLVLSAARPQHAGVYVCRASTPGTRTHSLAHANVTVLGEAPPPGLRVGRGGVGGGGPDGGAFLRVLGGVPERGHGWVVFLRVVLGGVGWCVAILRVDMVGYWVVFLMVDMVGWWVVFLMMDMVGWWVVFLMMDMVGWWVVFLMWDMVVWWVVFLKVDMVWWCVVFLRVDMVRWWVVFLRVDMVGWWVVFLRVDMVRWWVVFLRVDMVRWWVVFLRVDMVRWWVVFLRVDMAPQSLTRPRAGTARFVCAAAGAPAPLVTWLKNGERVRPNGRVKMYNSKLVINQITAEDDGVYQCQAESALGCVLAAARLVVVVSEDRPSAPRGLRAEAVSSAAVLLAWDRPLHNAAKVIAYSVHYMKAEGMNNEEYQVVIGNDTTRYIIDDLEPARNYTFYIVAYMPMGASCMSDPVVGKTLEDVPLRAPELSLTSRSPTDIAVSWAPLPAKLSRGRVTALRLAFRSGAEPTPTTLELPGGRGQHLLTDLRPDTTYLLRITAATGAGWGEPSAWTSHRTPKASSAKAVIKEDILCFTHSDHMTFDLTHLLALEALGVRGGPGGGLAPAAPGGGRDAQQVGGVRAEVRQQVLARPGSSSVWASARHTLRNDSGSA
ncbi:unnamed protein product [Boreogadus saida]